MLRRLVHLATVYAMGCTLAVAQTCPADTGDFSQSADLSVKKADASCTLDDGGYAKQNTVYKLHVSTTVTGWCQTYVYQNGQCVAGTYYNRTASSTNQRIDNNLAGLVYGNANVQNYNTCGNGASCTPVNTTSNGNSWGAFTLGTHVYTSINSVGGGTVGSGPQYCNMSGFQYPANHPITINVVKCAPYFNTDIWNNIVHLTPGTSQSTPTTNNIYVPPTLQGTNIDNAVIAAINQLNIDLNAYTVPVQFNRVTIEDSCTGSNCIKLSVAPTGTACALLSSPTTSASGGAITSPASLVISDAWTDAWYSNGFLTRTVSHELAHALGLKENACTSSDSIMGTFSACGIAMTTTALTLNDKLPIVSTTYGGGTRNACGF